MNCLRAATKTHGLFGRGSFGDGFVSFSSGMRPALIARSYSQKKRAPKVSVPVGYCSLETILTGRGITINMPNKMDESAEVGFLAPPTGYVNCPDKARKFGCQNWFTRAGSTFTLHFDEAFSTAATIDDYFEERKTRFQLKYPYGNVHSVDFSPVVTTHMDKNGIIHRSGIFNQRYSYQGEKPYMALFLKTPGGFWSLKWHSHLDNLMHRNAHFIKAVNDLKVVFRNKEDGTKVTSSQKLID